jgi:putative transposase
MKFGFVAKHRGIWPAEWLCGALGVSRGGFYAWLTRPRSQRSRSDEELGAKVRASFLASDRTYGARRVWHDMLAEGVSCGLHRIERLMRQQALKARPRRRRLPPDLGERQVAAVAPNVLDRSFEAPAPNRKWIADFTYVWTAEGWLYVAAVVDLFSRRVVGWSMNAAMTAQLVTDALVMAIWRRGKPDALLHHSDRGSQYTSEQFQRLMADHGVVCSMSRSGNVWDNAAMESFFSSLKIERTARRIYRTRDDAKADVFDYIERFYNRASEHPSGYVFEEKRFCWSGCDPAGYFGFCRARSVMDCAADVVKADRSKIQGPSDSGWTPSISPASAASRSVLGATFRSLAALPRLSHGSMSSAAALNTGMR